MSLRTLILEMRKAWPKERYPLARHAATTIWRALDKAQFRLRFFMWRRGSQKRYGERRWVILPTGRLQVQSSDFRSFKIYETGGTQKEKIQTWTNALDLNPEICIDAGANYGEFLLPIRNYQIKTIAIEANYRVTKCLQTSFQDVPHIRIAHVAIGESDRDAVKFFSNPESSGSGSLHKESPEFERVSSGRSGLVEESIVAMRTLDTLIKEICQNSPKSFVMKMDIENHELEALRGAKQLLSQARWWRAIVEFNELTLLKAGGNAAEVWNFYRQFNGRVIAKTPISSEAICNLTEELPKSFPGECDILIGQGIPL